MTKRETLSDPATPATSSPPDRESWRDFSVLPRDVLMGIFSRLPHADILRGAGLVCASWRRLAVAEPELWRDIDLSSSDDDKIVRRPTAMERAAVDRSACQCQSFRGPADGDFLAYLAARSPDLRSIHVTSWMYMPHSGFVEGVIKKLPLLERLVVSRGYFNASGEVMRAFLDHCPRLELLDAGGCYNSYAIGYRLRERCHRTIRNLRLPQADLSSCGCCMEYSQKHADQLDD